MMHRILTLFIFPVVLLASCSSDASESNDGLYDNTEVDLLSDDEISEGIQQQEDMIDQDSNVGQDLFREAYDNYFDCFRDAGIEIIDQGWDPINHYSVIFQIDVKANGTTDPDVTFDLQMTCGEAHLDLVQAAYKADNDPYMADDLADKTVECLNDNSVTVDEDFTSLHDLIEQSPQDTTLKKECVIGEHARTLPRQSFSVQW